MKLTANLDKIAEDIRQNLEAKDAAREKVLPLCREVIRYASGSIWAVHRRELGEAGELLAAARKLLDEVKKSVAGFSELASAGFISDAEKEFVEGTLVLAMVGKQPIPHPDELQVSYAAYLKGLGEAAGELRRYLLDSLRRDEIAQAEILLSAMDDIYSVLVTMDFPDALTGGLRHTTDNVRGILEKTRGDLTLMLTQKNLEQRLSRLEDKIP